MPSSLFNFTFILLALLFLLVVPTTSQQDSYCSQFATKNPTLWFPIIVRAPTTGGTNFGQNLAITQRYIYDRYSFPVRIGPQPPSTNCAGLQTQSGFEIELCPTGSTIPATTPSSFTQLWCNSRQNGSPRAVAAQQDWMSAILTSSTLNTASPQIAAFGDFIVSNLFTYLGNCNSLSNNDCFGDTSKTSGRVGNTQTDGILDGTEACDISINYFTDTNNNDYYVARCQRSQNIINANVYSLYSIKDGPENVNSHIQWCQDQNVCGIKSYNIKAYICQSRAPFLFWFYYTNYDKGACFNNIGLGHLAPDLLPQSCYYSPSSSQCGNLPATWLCGSKLDNTWVPCNNSAGVVSVLKTGQVIPPPGQILSANQLTPRTSSNFICGQLYRVRDVRCGIVSTNPAVASSIHPDNTCGATAKPTQVLPTETVSCTSVAFAYSYPSSGNSPSIPSVSSFRSLTQQVALPVPDPATPCTVSNSLTPCFGDCGTSYAVYYKCVTFGIADTNTGQFSVAETGDCSQSQFVSLVNNPTVNNLTNAGICKYETFCHDDLSISSPPTLCSNYTCNCAISRVYPFQSCYGTPYANTNGITRIASPFCQLPDQQNHFEKQCVNSNEKNLCYDPIITFIGDTPLPAVGPADPSLFLDATYNEYCTVQQDSDINGIWNSFMDVKCKLASQTTNPPTPLDPTLCPTTITDAKACTKVVGYEYRCTLDITNPTTSLSNFGIRLDLLSVSSAAFCHQTSANLPSSFISPKFCGQIILKPTIIGCWNSLNGQLLPSTSYCEANPLPDTDTAWAPKTYEAGCTTNCYDQQNQQLLGSCMQDLSSDLQRAMCGTAQTSVCSLSSQQIVTKCEMLNPTTSQWISALDTSLCTPPLGYGLLGSIHSQDCFKFNSNGDAITAQTPLTAFESVTAGSCSLQTTCQFAYTSSPAFSLDGMTSHDVSVNQWSASNCVNDFACRNFPTCGTIQRSSRCQFSQAGNPSLSDISTLLNALNHPDKLSGFACSSVSPSSCTSDGGCYEPRCWAPTDITSGTDIVVPSDSSSYIKDLCSTAGQQAHCTTKVTNQYCGKKALPIHQRYIDLRTEAFASKSPYNDSTEIEFQCYHYQNCTYSHSVCQWLGISDQGQIITIPGEVSPELCSKWLENPTTICDTGIFCGDAVTHSKCFLQDDDENLLTVEDLDTCTAAATAASQTFVNFQTGPLKQSCSNHRLCSAWTCTPPRESAALISAATINSQLTDFATASSYFDDSVGTFSQSSCFLPLDSPSAGKVCGLGQVVRNVGCLTKLIPPYVQTSSFKYDPDASKCGATDTLPPIRSQPMYSFQGCTSTFQCSLSQTTYSENTCSGLSCPALPQPTNTNSPNFWFQHQSLCIAQNGTIISPEQCNNSDDWFSSLFKTVTLKQCQYMSDYCASNFRVPLGFGPEANVTLSTGKYDPLRGKAADPLSLSFMLDSNCSKKIQITDVSIFAGGSSIPQRSNMTVASGATNSLSISYSMVNTADRIQTLTAYLVPVILQDNLSQDSSFFQLPYPLLTFSISGSRQNLPILSHIPPGEYLFVLYHSAMAFKSIPNIFITIIPAAPSPFISDFSTHTTATDNSCASYQCYNGNCIAGSDEKPICECSTGFTSSLRCTTPTVCTTYTPPTPAEGETSFEIPKCNTTNGFIGPALSQTTGSLSIDPQLVCTTCHCLGNYSPIDGCTACTLQCGAGVPDDSCQNCICPAGYSGIQCECQHRQFMLNYRSLPPIIDLMFTRSSSQTRVLRYGSRVDPIKYEPQSALETAQLIAWKRIIIVELSADLNISADFLDVVHWGSRGSLFTVFVDVKQCAGYSIQLPSPPSDNTPSLISTPTTYDVNDLESQQRDSNQPQALDQTTPSVNVNLQLALLQNEELGKTWANFTSIVTSLSQYANNTAPLIGLDNLYTILSDYHPSFNYTTLVRRFAALGTTSMSNVVHHQDLATIITTEEDQFLAGYEDVTPNFDNPLLTSFHILAGSGVNMDGTDIFQYKQTNSAIGIAADASGGFLGFGDTLYSQADCSANSNIPCSNTPVNLPTLDASTPATPQPSKSFDPTILIAVLIPLLFLLILALAIFLCCAWKYQTFCFQGYREKRKQNRRAQRELRKNQRDAALGGSTVEASCTELSGPTGATSPNTVTAATGVTSRTTRNPAIKGASTPTSFAASTPVAPIPALALSEPRNMVIIDDEDEDDDDDEDYEYGDAFDEGTEISAPQIANKPVNKRGSLHIGGLRRISVAGLPPGWTMLMLEKKPIYINETTMQSTSIKPNLDGTLPSPKSVDQNGW